MSYRILTIPPFDSQLKRLAKKYPSLKREIEELGNELSKDPLQGVSLGKTVTKSGWRFPQKEKATAVEQE